MKQLKAEAEFWVAEGEFDTAVFSDKATLEAEHLSRGVVLVTEIYVFDGTYWVDNDGAPLESLEANVIMHPNFRWLEITTKDVNDD